jgi:serine O-acetyltransferase
MNGSVISADALWQRLQSETIAMSADEPLLAGYLRNSVLDRESLIDALSHLLARKLTTESLSTDRLVGVFSIALGSSSEIMRAISCDLLATADRDPASHGIANPFLNYKGFHALEMYRAYHYLWLNRRYALACYLQGRASEVFAADIHPAATIGCGLFIDHGTGIVIGETAVIEDNVSILQDVTLGGTGKVSGDRHPKVGKGVLIGAGAKVLGNIRVGEGAKIGAGSVVLKDVPPHTTVVGIPARAVGHPKSHDPALVMDQAFDDDAGG